MKKEKKKESLPLVTTWTKIKDVILSEISQSHLHVESQTFKHIKAEGRMVSLGAGEWDGWRGIGQKVQSISCAK